MTNRPPDRQRTREAGVAAIAVWEAARHGDPPGCAIRPRQAPILQETRDHIAIRMSGIR